MKIKTYRSESVTKALEQVRKELGPDAVILKTKRIRKRRLMGLVQALTYEITAASESSETVKNGSLRPIETYEVSNRPPRPVPPGQRRGVLQRMASSKGDDPILREDRLQPHMSKLTAEIEEIKRMVSSSRNVSIGGLDLSILEDGWESTGTGLTIDWKAAKEAVSELRRLISDGVDETLAHTLVKFAIRELAKTSEDQTDIRAHLNRAVRNMVQTSDDHGRDPWGRKLSVFIGPTGVGKTTTIAKLAANFALGEHRKVQLITFDTYRIAAAEQLKTYADIIGVPIRTASTVEELKRAIEESASRDRVLIDTTGHSHKRSADFAELSGFLRAREDIEKHLVLSITTKPADLREIIDGFEDYDPHQLVFTKLDETSTFGSIASEVILSGKPLSYLTNGQAVPDDLQIPNSRAVADLVVPMN